MKRTLALSALAISLMTTPLSAFDLSTMSADERAAFRAEIRSYLMENPEVIMEAVALLEERQQAAQAAGDSDLIRVNAEDIFNDGKSWVGGNLEGDITLVEFTDYRCGYCRKAHDEVAELVKSDGNIRFIIKEFPILGEDSIASSRFAIAVKKIAGDDAYKAAHDALITLKAGANTESLTRLANDLGLDATAIFAEMNSDETTAVIAQNHALAGRMQISGTPTFILEGEMLRGYVPLDGMKQLVAQVRQK